VTNEPGIFEELFSGEPKLPMAQRMICIGLGLGLAAASVKPRPTPLLSVLALGAGSYLAFSGYRAYCPLKAVLFHDQDRARLTHSATNQVG
jgi:hypothetical protein